MNTSDKSADMSDADIAKLATVFRDGIFRDRVVLVSGGGTWLGKATAALFARLGATVVICGRNGERLEQAAEFLRSLGGKVSTHAMTIRDPDQAAALMDKVWS